MSFPADSFFDIWVTLTIFITFTGALLVTFYAPQAVIPGNMFASVFVEMCDEYGRYCVEVPVPFNVLWGGLLNGVTYGVLGGITYIGARSIIRKIK